jgi:hypothetical protein
MINQLSAIETHTGTLHSYRTAISSIRTAYATSMSSSQVPESPSAPPGQQTRPTPLPIRPSHSRTATNPSTPHTTLPEQILRRFDIPPPPTRDALLTSSVSTHMKLLAQYAASSQAAVDMLSKSLEERKRANQTVLNLLHACSEYASVSLTEGEMGARLQRLDRGVADVASRAADVNGGEG